MVDFGDSEQQPDDELSGFWCGLMLERLPEMGSSIEEVAR
jgi:hypothetical protein